MARNDDQVPADPQTHPVEAVEALERDAEAAAADDEEGVPAEDVTDNPDTGELEGLPGPSPEQPGESAG